MASLRKEPFRILSAFVSLVVVEAQQSDFFFAGLHWQSWTFWTRCLRSKWVWPIRSMDSLCQVSQVCSCQANTVWIHRRNVLHGYIASKSNSQLINLTVIFLSVLDNFNLSWASFFGHSKFDCQKRRYCKESGYRWLDIALILPNVFIFHGSAFPSRKCSILGFSKSVLQHTWWRVCLLYLSVYSAKWRKLNC